MGTYPPKGLSMQDIRDALLTDNTKFAGSNISNLDKAISTLNDLAQSDILSDGTPFPGGNIDAAISSRSTLTKAEIVSGFIFNNLSLSSASTVWNTVASIDVDVTNVNYLMWYYWAWSGSVGSYYRLQDTTNAVTLAQDNFPGGVSSKPIAHPGIDISGTTGAITLAIQIQTDGATAKCYHCSVSVHG